MTSSVEVAQTKVVLRRESGYPVGQSAPLYVICLCGQKLTMRVDGVICDVCGRSWDSGGWFMGSPSVYRGGSIGDDGMGRLGYGYGGKTTYQAQVLSHDKWIDVFTFDPETGARGRRASVGGPMRSYPYPS